MMCLVQEIAVLVISGVRLKTGVCGSKKSAVSEVDPCGGVEKHSTRIRYEINKYVLERRRMCPCVVQAHSGHTGY